MQEEAYESSSSNDGRWRFRLKHVWSNIRRAWPIGVVLLASFLGVFLYNAFYPAPIPLTGDEIDEIVQQQMASATPPPTYSSVVYQIILPSLVYIQTNSEHYGEEDAIGVGSGVVINENGEILTAYHVVEDATEIKVIFAEGTEATAEIIASEPENDIAVLQPNRPPDIIVPAVIGNSNAMRIGDEAFAVGNPLGLVGSMSAGVISGFNRSIPIKTTGERLEGLIQFDTAVNPGNSGGPLLNRYGQVVGIVTALANPSEQNFFVGIGFAVPIGTASQAAGAPDY